MEKPMVASNCFRNGEEEKVMEGNSYASYYGFRIWTIQKAGRRRKWGFLMMRDTWARIRRTWRAYQKKEPGKGSRQKKEPMQRPCGGKERICFKNFEKGSKLWHREQNLFSKVIHTERRGGLY